MSKKDRFLRACRCEPVDVTPIWLMRQAGRYMAAYRALRRKHTLLDMIRAPDLAAQVTLQPIQAFDLDAAIVFADILPLLETLGLQLEFTEGQGPHIRNPLRSPTEIRNLPETADLDVLTPTFEAIRMVSRELQDSLPVIGFSGAPFTLACYAIEGGSSKDYLLTRAFMHTHPAAWHQLMERLSVAAGRYLRAQIEAGAKAAQLFDSWAGVLSPGAYREYVLPHSRRAMALARENNDAPLIHFATHTAALLPLLREAGGTVLGADWRMDIAAALPASGGGMAIQGNLDPAVLLSTPEVIRREAARVLDGGRAWPGHVFNLGHGVHKETPEEHVKLLVDFVHEYSAKS